MSSAIAHRGPDDEGIWYEGQIGLAHRRLSVIDLSSLAHQPMISQCGRYAIVFNGEIYNYREMRSDLFDKGFSFSSQSDTEVLLASYKEWGANCLNRLNGMWAFVIWDRFEKRLFASRDRFGKKPLYYVQLADGFVFASEIKAILASGLVNPRVNPVAVADFSADRVSDHSDETFFLDIKQLTPGSWLEWHKGQIRIGKYWSLSLEGRKQSDPDEILKLLTDAVEIRLRADTPVGVLLSGGLDSSSVTGLAASHAIETIHAFSTLDDPPVEEAKGIEKVLEKYSNVVLHSHLMSRESFLSDLENCLWHQEEPFADGSMVAHFQLMRLARKIGIKVLLSGQGADEVFAGYPGYLSLHLADLLSRGQLWKFVQYFRDVLITGGRISLASVIGYSLPSFITSRVRQRKSIASIDWLATDYRNVSDSVGRGFSGENYSNTNMALLDSIQRRTLPGFLHYEDRNSMAHGIETRLPFLDYRLVETVLPIPPEDKIKSGVTKTLLRQAVRDIVPRTIIERTTKTGYPAPLIHWLREAQDTVWSEWKAVIRRCPLIEYSSWDRHHKFFRAGKDSALSAVWRGLILSLWHQRFIAKCF